MTNDGAATAVSERGGRLAVSRFDRYLSAVIAVFALAYTAQCCDALAAGYPSMSGPGGFVVIGLVCASVTAGVAAAVLSRWARPLFRAATACYALAALVWTVTLHGHVPASPMPWFTGMWPAQIAYVIAVRTRTRTAIAVSAVAALAVNGVLVVRGGMDPGDAVANGLYMLTTSVILILMVRAVRHGIARAGDAQRIALDEYGRTQLDEATEAERVRTDALVHDIVLTTFMAARNAGSGEEEALTRRMAGNAMRVLGHVTRSADLGPAAPLRRALIEAAADLDPLLPHFAVRSGRAEDVMLPVTVAGALVEAMVQSMDNSLRHAGATAIRTLTVSELGPDGVRIVVDDDGAGFDPATVDGRLGLQRQVIERLRRVDGRADLRSIPGHGTTVVLSWGSVVISGTTPLAQEFEVTA